MRIIFVGVHNKEGMTPLDSMSKSGKLIDRIINELPYNCIKTNLYDRLEMPIRKDKYVCAGNWYDQIHPQHNDVLVLLGNEVQNNVPDNFSNEIRIKHPSIIWSNKNKDEYVISAVAKIKKYCN